MVRAILLKNTDVTSWIFATSAKVTGVRMEQGMYICKGFCENKIMLVGKQVTPQQLNELLLKKVNSLLCHRSNWQSWWNSYFSENFMSLVPEEIMQMHWTQALASSSLMNLEVLQSWVCLAMFAVLTQQTWNARGISEYCGKYLIDVDAQGKVMVNCFFF